MTRYQRQKKTGMSTRHRLQSLTPRVMNARRLLVEQMAISRIQLLLDVHVSASGGGGIPLDTHAAPLLLSPVIATRLLFRPAIMAHGLLAHFVAEALLSAPQMLGSLELLLNPTGEWLTEGALTVCCVPVVSSC